MTLYIQLHIFWSMVSERKVLLATYAAAYQCVHGRSEAQYASLSGQVDNYNEPLKRAVEEFKDESFCKALGDILAHLTPVIAMAHNTDSLRQKNVLNPIEEGDAMPLPVVTPMSGLSGANSTCPPLLHPNLHHLDDYTTQIIYSVLACPTLLYRDDVMLLFNMVATDVLVVPLFRDHVLNVHTELENLGAWFPLRTWTGPAVPKGLKLKVLFKDLAKEATMTAGLKHRERRSYLRGEISTLINLFNQLPGLLAPKFPMVMCALRMSKSELLWYFRHKGQNTVKSRQKHYNEEEYGDPFAAILLGLHDELLRLVYGNGKIVQNYYIEYMQGAHRSVLEEALTGLRSHTAAFSSGVQTILASITTTIDGLSVNDDCLDLEGFRLDWYRATAALTAFGSNSLKIPEVQNLISRMIRVVEHSRYVDALRETVENQCELHELWWCKESFKEEYTGCLTNSTASLYATAFVRTLRVMAEKNCHSFCPEEQMPIGQECARTADDMLTQLADAVDQLIYPLIDLIEGHEDQISSDEAARRIERQQAAKARRQAGGVGPSEIVPGHESVLSNAGRQGISELISLERNISRLLWGVNRADEIAVYDRIVRPKEYVRSQLVSHFVNFTNTMFEAEGGGIIPPSQALKALHHTAAAMQKCTSHLDIELPSLLREALFEQSCESEVYDVAAVLKGIPSVGGLGQRNVHKVASFYLDLVERSSSSGCVYAPATDSFVRLMTKRGGATLGLDAYATPSELKALCLLVGTQGCRVLDSALLNLVAAHASKIQTFMSMNEASLSQFSVGFLGEASMNFDPVCSSIKGIHELVQSSLIVGNALAVRGMLHRATGMVQRDTVPLINSALSLAAASVSHDAEGGANFPSLMSLARSSGVDVGVLDPSLQASLAHMVTDKDKRLWKLLPYAYSAAFALGDTWKTTQYVPALDVLSQGEHVMMYACSNLCTSILGPVGGKEASEQFIKSACGVLFRMKSEDANKYYQFPIRAMFSLMEKFVQYSPVVDRSVLENHLPYTILHAAYVDMSLKKQRAGDTGMDSNEAFKNKTVVVE
jgi:NCK-associated protein 1